jgi:hypothetical protein
VSSNDRYNRYGRQQPSRQQRPSAQDDDVLYDDAWVEDDDVVTPPPPQRRTRTNPTRTQASQPRIQGTAAQIDQLRRNLQQPNRTQSGERPRITMPQRSTRVPFRQPVAPPRDDVIVDDQGYYGDDDWSQPAAPSRTRPAVDRTQTAARTVSTPQPVYDDFDDSYDDEYAEYEDDFSEYDAPSRAARPRPQISMPSISRPTLPPAIANADLVNDATALGLIGTAVLSLATMAILVANRIDSLAPEFATHVSASGLLEDFRGESALWRLPLLATMFTLMNLVIAWFVAPLDRFASRFVLVAAIAVQFVAWVAVIRLL